MRRRTLLLGCLSLVVIPGCLDAPSTSDETGPGGTPEAADTTQIQQAYVIHLESADGGIDEEDDACEFDEFTDAAQDEIEQAIDQEEYRVGETPELMMRNCHNGYVEYESEYYLLRITIESG